LKAVPLAAERIEIVGGPKVEPSQKSERLKIAFEDVRKQAGRTSRFESRANRIFQRGNQLTADAAASMFGTHSNRDQANGPRLASVNRVSDNPIGVFCHDAMTIDLSETVARPALHDIFGRENLGFQNLNGRDVLAGQFQDLAIEIHGHSCNR
jgi:hypothetical protein